MLYKLQFFLAGFIFLLHFQVTAQDQVDCESTFDFMYEQWGRVENMRYHSEKIERQLDGEKRSSFDFTVRKTPFSVAGLMEEKGHWILYNEQDKKEEAVYIPDGFPYTNLDLNIHGSIFRGLNHYTISDAGCEFVLEIIGRQYERIPESFTCTRVTRKGNDEILIRAETDQFRWNPYQPDGTKNVLEVAHENSVSAYLLIERNESLDEYTEKVTSEIMVPTHYGTIVEIYMDADHGLPMLIRNYDEKGQYEQYEYSNYEFDVPLPEEFFTEDYLDDLN